MNETQRLLVIGVYINSALYLIGVFTAGVIQHVPHAWQFALLSAGVAYLSYWLQIIRAPEWVNIVLVGISVGAGFAAGVEFLI
jgi:hypothetical protein